MIRVLIADDSASFREVLKGLIAKDARLSVVGEAASGAEALERVRALKPDVLTLDVSMPGLDGFDVLREVMTTAPLPILVISAAAQDGKDTVSFQALTLGALDVLGKPNLGDARALAKAGERICQAIRVVAGVRPVTRTASGTAIPVVSAAGTGTSAGPAVRIGERPPAACVGIAASTGGPQALQTILRALPPSFPAPILVAQHIAEGFTAGLTKWLAQETQLKVKVAEPDEQLSAGTVYFARDGHHLLTSRGRVRLDAAPEVRGVRPSANVLLAAVARDFGRAALGVVLTGMGDDGALGLQLVKQQGGYTLVQDEHTAVVAGMPVAARGAAEAALPVDRIADELVRLTQVAGATERRRRLLLVDDSETMLRIEQAMLQGRYELFLARNGQEAVEACRTLQPDAVLMDYTMPVMNGGDALRELKSDFRTEAIPVVMITGETDPSIWKRCEAAGAVCVLKKPLTEPMLNQALKRANVVAD